MHVALAPSFMMIMSLFGGGLNLMGLPPGERDLNYQNAAPADSIVYLEWAARGEGTPGGKGIEGLAGDPEVRAFFSTVRTQLLETIERETARGQNVQEQTFGRTVPPIIETMLQHAGCVSVSIDQAALQPDAQDQQLRQSWLSAVRVTVIVDAADAAQEFEQHLLDAVSTAMELPKPEKGLNRWKLDIPLPGAEVMLHREGNHFILGFGTGTVDRAIAGLKGEVKGLGDLADYQTAVSRTKIERVGTVVWVNVAQVKNLVPVVFSHEVPPFVQMALDMADMVGVGNLNAMMTTTGLDRDEFASKSFLSTGGTTDGVLALAAGRGLTPADFKHIPTDADFVSSITLDSSHLLTALRATLTKVDANLVPNMDAMLSQFNNELGFSLDEDFPAAFGQQWTVFNAPTTGGFFVTAPIATLEVKDAAKAQAIFDKLMAFQRQTLPGVTSNEYSVRGVTLEEKSFEQHKIFFVNTIGNDMPLAPAYCLTKTHLLVALHPTPLKAYLRWQVKPTGSFSDVFARHVKSDGDVFVYNYFDTKTLAKHTYGFLPYFAQIAASELQRERFEIDLFALPSSQAILPYLGDSYSFVTRTKDGLVSSGTSIFPVATTNLGMMFFGVMPRGGTPPEHPAIDAPAEADFE